MIGFLASASWPIQKVFNGNAAFLEPDAYANVGTEIWYHANDRIQKGDIILPHDRIFFEQAVNRERKFGVRALDLIYPDLCELARTVEKVRAFADGVSECRRELDTLCARFERKFGDPQTYLPSPSSRRQPHRRSDPRSTGSPA